MNKRIAIIGAGNLGCSIADGLLASGFVTPEQLILTRRNTPKLNKYKGTGILITSDNTEAVRLADVVILSVEPHHSNSVLAELKSQLNPEKQILISVVTGLGIRNIKHLTYSNLPVVRSMPNTAISIRESMTCLAGEEQSESMTIAKEIFDCVGETVVIGEEQMGAATALAACGVAFFLRSIRAASQGGIQIGFNAETALKIASQTARGAASLLVQTGNHPESEIDRVTTPMGCTIAGLNQMEHEGFSSAMIKGIVMSAGKADGLYHD